MEAHYTYLTELGISEPAQKWITSIGVMLLILIVAKVSTRHIIASADGVNNSVIPDKQPTLRGFIDLFIEGFVKFHDSILGRENRSHVSFNGALFIFLLSSNLIGLIPGMAGPTTISQINVGLALVVFFYFNYMAIKVQGIKGYFAHLCGPIPLLAILLLPVELFSLLLRPATLSLRLFWNVSADHMVLGIFTDKIVPGFGLLGLPFYALGTFVCFMQAFIFTTLTMVYILRAVQHEEEH